MSVEPRYRPEIDGLRALAVMPVIYYHAGFPGLPGGFLGVDVFFVISGFLISRILLNELHTGQFSLLAFYERRARRILPALFVMMALTWPLAFWLMPPDAFDIYQGSMWATSIFGSNVYFLNTNGYFQPAAELQPLLHTWSLAVEEQYYLVFPLLLAALYHWFRPFLIWIILGLVLLSFFICIWQFERSPEVAFYLIHTRAWELLAGVAVTLALNLKSSRIAALSKWREPLGMVGLALIASGYMIAGEESPTPGLTTLLPVTGAMLALAHSNGNSLSGRLLSWAPLVGIGVISYSAYLWHHPLFAFAKLYDINEPSALVMIALTGFTFILAWLSYCLVERPWRDLSRFTRNEVFGAAIASIAILSAWGVLGDKLGVSTGRLSQTEISTFFPPISKAESCDWVAIANSDEIKVCHFGKQDEPHPVILWGDSHAAALKDELHQNLLALGKSGVFVNGSTCIRTPGIYPKAADMEKRAAHCEGLQKALYEFLEKQDPSAVLLSMRWTMRLYPVPGAGDRVGFDNGEGGRESETSRTTLARDETGSWTIAGSAKAAALETLFNKLNSLASLTIVGPVPEVGWNVGDTNFKAMHLHNLSLPEINTSFLRFEERNQFIRGVLQRMEGKSGIQVVWPHKLLCNTTLPGRCLAQSASTSFYGDDDHLSTAGVQLVLKQVMLP